MAAIVATGANAHKLPPERGSGGRTPKSIAPLANMDEIAQAAQVVLQHIRMTREIRVDGHVTGFINQVRQYAQQGDALAMAKVSQTLEKLSNDTFQAFTRLSERMTTIEKATTAISSSTNTTISSTQAAANWTGFRNTKDWQRGLVQAAAVSARSNGTSSPGVSELELQEDREVTIKVMSNRTQLRMKTPRELVEQAERQREAVARQRNSAALAGGAYFVAARKLPSGDITMVANSAAGAELLRKHTGWIKAFGADAVIQRVSWGVVAHGVPIRRMKLSSETMAGVAAELQRANGHTWGGKADISHVSWLRRPPSKQREGSIVIEFTSPIVANHAIAAGVIWENQVLQAVRFCREGRSKLCKKCQKPGHIQFHCPNDTKCGYCAADHSTWECVATKGQKVTIKCANCGDGHRPVSDSCPVKQEAVAVARQALLNCPAWHRIPLHFRDSANRGQSTVSQNKPNRAAPAAEPGLDASIHAPEASTATGDAPKPADANSSSLEQFIKPKRGRPKGSKNKSKDSVAPALGQTNSELVANLGRVTRSSQREQRQSLEGFTVSKKQRTAETADVMDEQPDDNFWSQLPPIEAGDEMSTLNEFTTINDRAVTPELQPNLPEIDPSSPEYQSLMLRLNYGKPRAPALAQDSALDQTPRSSPIFITSDPHQPTDSLRQDGDFDDESSSSGDSDNEEESEDETQQQQ
jgi:hypothetical protein